MRIPVRASIRRIEQAHTVSVFGTLNLDLWQIIKGGLRRLKLTWFDKKFEPLYSNDLVIKLRKPSAEHQFSYLYEEIAARFWEVKDWKFVLKKEFKDKLSNINNPYSASTFILNEFFESCDSLTKKWQAPFECIDQKRTSVDRSVAKNIPKELPEEDEEEIVEEVKEKNTPVKKETKTKDEDIMPTTLAWIPWMGMDYWQEMLKREQQLYGGNISI